MTKMKVLNISTSSLFYNGIGIVLLNYYQNMNDNRIIMDYVSAGIVDKEYEKVMTTKGNKIYDFSYKGKKMRQERPLKYCLKLYKIIKNGKYDIVHVHGSSSMLFIDLIIAKIAGVKIRIAHSHNTKSNNSILNKILRPLFRRSYTHAFACGEEAGKWLFGSNSKFVIIPNGKDCSLYQYNEETRKKIRKKYNFDENDIVIGHVGNFYDQKNHKFLLEVFYELTKVSKKYKLLLIGSGTLMENIKELAKKLSIKEKVIFLGQVSVEEAAQIIQGMDIMVFPSKFEGFPNVLIEWQISGLPCVISDKITKKVSITDLVIFKSIDDKPIKWAKTIQNININNRLKNKNKVKEQIIKAGFDIKDNAKMLESLYLNLLNYK